MKTVVYRLQASGGCSWHMSLDIRADRDHWIRQYGHMFKMYVLEPSLSFGQASMLHEALNQAGPKEKPWEVLRQIGSRLRIPAERIRSYRLWEWSPSNEETGVGPFQTPEELAYQLNLLSASIQGRYLFMEEWDALSAYEGWSWAEPERNYMLQSAWLTGKIELDCGIRMTEPPKRRLLCRAWPDLQNRAAHAAGMKTSGESAGPTARAAAGRVLTAKSA
ncbi:hypothetical protein LJK87_36840 [Paenibacillus sp. P25]|nr:hypothetical protein LJK87_36840 [Paenibacillus sp. P25]